MYSVSIFNDNVETVIHYPSSDQNDPHLSSLPLKDGLSLVDSLSFSIYPNNPGYNKITDLVTKIKVIDIRDNSVRFTGRILNAPEKMENSGLLYKDVTCEGAMSYLNDSRQRANTFITTTAIDFLTQILEIHNSKVDGSKQIQVGNVDITKGVAHTCNFETTLAEILAVKENVGGDIRVRENDGVLYLDWLENFSEQVIDIMLGVNMKDMIKDKDVTSFGTRIIPLGANNLTISSVNGGLDYIEDTNAKNIYGVIEKPVEYREIEDPQKLYDTCLADLNKYTQPLYLLESNALDLSCLSGNKTEQFTLGVKLHIYNAIMAVDSIYKAVQIDLDLLKAYDPKLTIANAPIKLTTTVNDLRKSSIQNNGVYNNVQVGSTFGIRAVRSDGQVTTMINATEGISIENQNEKIFYVDLDGVLRAIKGIFDDITTNNMIANNMRTSNTNTYIISHDQYIEFFKNSKLIMQLGFDELNASPTVKLVNSDGNKNGVGITGTGNLEPLGPMEFNSDVDFYGAVRKNGENIVTKSYVDDIMNEHISQYHSLQ